MIRRAKGPRWRAAVVVTVVAAAAAAAAILVAAGVVIAPGAETPSSTSSSAAATPTPKPTPTPTPTDPPDATPPPRVASVRGTVPGWTLADPLLIASVHPAVGSAATGAVSVLINAPVVESRVDVIATSAAVQPSTSYTVGVTVRQMTATPTRPSAQIVVGGRRFSLPEITRSWQRIEFDYATAAEESSVSVSLALYGAALGLEVDDFTLQSDDGASVLANSSFEDVQVEAGVANDSLILSRASATIGLSLAPGDAAWSVTAGDGRLITQGVAALRGPITAIPLEDVEQGYFTFSVTDAAGRVIETPIAVIDMESLRLAPDPRFGAGLHLERPWYEDSGSLTASLGIGIARNDMLWKLNEKERGVYAFDPLYTDGFARLRANGVDAIAIVDYNNKLYDSGKTVQSPEGLAAFGNYAAAIVRSFDVSGIEVFNEYNHSSQSTSPCGKSADCYLPMLQSVFASVKAVDPHLPVIAGATARYDGDWFRRLWALGGEQFADAMSFHPYEIVGGDVSSSRPDAIGDLVTQAEADTRATTASGRSIPVWITEIGWPTKSGGVPLDQQGSMLVRSVLSAIAAGAENAMWYDLVNDSTDPSVHEGNFGLFFQRTDGVAAYPPKPAAFAQALLSSQIALAPMTDATILPSGAKSLRFGAGEKAVHVLWQPTGTSELTVQAEGALRVTRMDGSSLVLSPQDGTAHLTVTEAPTFVEGPVTLDGAE